MCESLPLKHYSNIKGFICPFFFICFRSFTIFWWYKQLPSLNMFSTRLLWIVPLLSFACYYGNLPPQKQLKVVSFKMNQMLRKYVILRVNETWYLRRCHLKALKLGLEGFTGSISWSHDKFWSLNLVVINETTLHLLVPYYTIYIIKRKNGKIYCFT